MSEWLYIKLGNITTKIGSGSTPTGGSNAYKESGISLIRSQNVLDLKFSVDGLAFIDDEQADKLKNVSVEENDVLLNITGDSVARCCKAPKEWLPARVNQHVAIIRSDEKQLFPNFLKYTLISSKDELLMLSEIGGTRNALTKGMLEEFEIKLPPLLEQKAIADVLSALDDKIDLLQRQNETLEKMAETLFRQWFIEENNSTGSIFLGEMIDIHDSKRIPLSKMEREQKKRGGILYPYYGAANIMDYIDEYIFDGNYLLIGEDGTVQDENGYPILQRTTGKFWVNNHAHIVSALEPYSNFFIWCLLSKTNVEKIITGAVQPKINQGNLKSLEFNSFDLDKVQRFVKLTASMEEKISINNIQIQTLQNLRDTLLPKLMSGEVRVKLD